MKALSNYFKPTTSTSDTNKLCASNHLAKPKSNLVQSQLQRQNNRQTSKITSDFTRKGSSCNTSAFANRPHRDCDYHTIGNRIHKPHSQAQPTYQQQPSTRCISNSSLHSASNSDEISQPTSAANCPST